MTLLYAVLLAWPWVVVHEGAHALAVVASGGQVTRFRPWPHRWADGSWVWGAMRYRGVPTWGAWRALVSGAPALLDVAVVGAWLVVGGEVLGAMALCAWVDTTYNWGSLWRREAREGQDAWGVVAEGMPLWVGRVLVVAWVMGGVMGGVVWMVW